MIRKLKKWRDNLTVPQVYKIMWIGGIITEVIVTLSIILNRDQIMKNPELPIWFVWFAESALIVLAIVRILYLSLKGMEKELDLEREKNEKEISPKLKEEEFTEVYLKQSLRIDVDEVILDGYDAHKKRYFAKKKEDGVYVIMKEEENIIKEYPNLNYQSFDYHFTVTKEEQ